MKRINFLGYPVDSVNIEDSLEWMEEKIKSQIPSSISVINANKLWQMSKDSRLAQFVSHSELVIPEWAVYWGAAKLKTPLKSPVYGVSLLKAALPWAGEKGFRVFFLGAKPAVIDALTQKLHNEYPKVQIAGAHHGYFHTAEENDKLCAVIKKSAPDILFVAMGSPRQEYWIQENLIKVNVPVAMGVGGSFDVIAGLKPDTPTWARGHGLEWLYRLSQDPKSYWKRYLITNPWFIWLVFREQLHRLLTGVYN